MITIGQLAWYVGVSTKTVRVYHNKGLLPEPDRDASGYRRYGANDVIDLNQDPDTRRGRGPAGPDQGPAISARPGIPAGAAGDRRRAHHPHA
ncbi:MULTISPECIES: MerR family transcriptional regulator [Streptomyces]|uniref:MerR family transcriptional regulator n=1 Tax=Streptomyces TaxID=1883 RepID=UPI0028AE045D|nr:MerR family transcriptional regulator [Streptomyces sp. WAC05858]